MFGCDCGSFGCWGKPCGACICGCEGCCGCWGKPCGACICGCEGFCGCGKDGCCGVGAGPLAILLSKWTRLSDIATASSAVVTAGCFVGWAWSWESAERTCVSATSAC